MAIIKTTISGKSTGTLTPPNIKTPYIVNGVATKDTIDFSTSTADNDIFGKAGNDIITGGTGNDLISGGLGADTLTGGKESDTLLGYAPVNSKVPTEVTTSLTDGNDSLNAGAGDDNLDGGAGNDALTGGIGSDWFSIFSGTDSVSDLGNGSDILLVGAGATVNATLFAAWTSNTQSEISGIANLSSNGFTVNVSAATGSKGFNITNKGVATTFTGSANADNLTGGAGNDTLNGGAGNDSLNGGAGRDKLSGGTGNDTYIIDTTTDTITEASTAGSGTDTVKSSVSYNLGANLENLTLTGTTKINGTGNTLANILTGNTNDNSLNGGTGNDKLIGGAGNDNLTGGNGADIFVFNVAANALTNKDTITDFVHGTDKLQFSLAVLNKLGTLGAFTNTDQRFYSSPTGLAHDATDRLIYNTKTGDLAYDADGNGSIKPIVIETLGLSSHPALSANDISIIA